MPLYPSGQDDDWSLWKKIATNLYDYALSRGASGLEPPSWNDNQVILQKKVAYYTAAIDPIQ